jgi:hypothetical protein
VATNPGHSLLPTGPGKEAGPTGPGRTLARQGASRFDRPGKPSMPGFFKRQAMLGKPTVALFSRKEANKWYEKAKKGKSLV